MRHSPTQSTTLEKKCGNGWSLPWGAGATRTDYCGAIDRDSSLEVSKTGGSGRAGRTSVLRPSPGRAQALVCRGPQNPLKTPLSGSCAAGAGVECTASRPARHRPPGQSRCICGLFEFFQKKSATEPGWWGEGAGLLLATEKISTGIVDESGQFRESHQGRRPRVQAAPRGTNDAAKAAVATLRRPGSHARPLPERGQEMSRSSRRVPESGARRPDHHGPGEGGLLHTRSIPKDRSRDLRRPRSTPGLRPTKGGSTRASRWLRKCRN